MPRDIKILSIDSAGQLFDQTYPVPDQVDGSYALAQRVVKNLKTVPGTDEQDPGWGSALFSRLMAIPAQRLDLAKSTATGALQKCFLDIANAQPTDPSLRVTAIHLVSLTPNVEATTWDLTIEVVTASTTIQLPLAG